MKMFFLVPTVLRGNVPARFPRLPRTCRLSNNTISTIGKNNIAIVFFRCTIQATDSTFTGCTAKIIAAKNAPGIDQLPQNDPDQQ